MKKTFKRFLLIFISMTLITPGYLLAEVTEVCGEEEISDFFPMGDEKGKAVQTRRNIAIDCNVTYDVQGPCIRWEEEKVEYDLNPDQYNTYRSKDNTDGLGPMFAGVSAYDQLDHLWSGWHGYCEEGTKHDFSWAEDPMYWASLAMSMVMDAGASGGPLSSEMESVNQAAQSALQSTFETIGVELTENMAGCLIEAGIDLSFMAASAILEDDEPPCDPIDEFCENEDEISEEGDIFTMNQQEYDNLLAEHPEIDDYLVLIKTEGNVLTFRYITPDEVDGADQLSEEEMNKLQDEIKQMMLYINAAMLAGKLAFCGVTGNGGTSTSTSTDTSPTSVTNMASTAISMIPAEWLGPYGFLIKAAAQVLLQVLSSFEDIDTCKIKEDAEQEGERHLATYKSLKYDLCHYNSITCAQEEVFGDDCSLEGYNYCCYDQLLTRILVEQIKAQLGRDWAHCTGITMRDLGYVSFQECDDVDKTYGTEPKDNISKIDYLDETNVIYDSNTSYQYKRKCIDMTEFKDYIKNIFNENIDKSDFDDTMDDIAEQA